MELYTVRVKIQPVTEIPRGAGTVEFTLNFQAETDADMLSHLPILANQLATGPLFFRWRCVRGNFDVHEVAAYRREITHERRWHYIGHELWSLDDLPEITVSGEIFELPISWTMQQYPKFSHQRGAILCVQRGEDIRCKRRVYIGPISSHYYAVDWSIAGFETFTLAITSEIPYGPRPGLSDSVDLWPLFLVNEVSEFLAGLTEFSPLVDSVVPSFKWGFWSLLQETSASTVRAELRSRAVRGEMGTVYP